MGSAVLCRRKKEVRMVHDAPTETRPQLGACK